MNIMHIHRASHVRDQSWRKWSPKRALQKSPIDTQKSPIDTQKRPVDTQKSPVNTHRASHVRNPSWPKWSSTQKWLGNLAQKSPTDTQKSPTDTQKSPTDTQKSSMHIFMHIHRASHVRDQSWRKWLSRLAKKSCADKTSCPVTKQHIRAHTHTRTHKYTHTYTHVHTNIHAHTHT